MNEDRVLRERIHGLNDKTYVPFLVEELEFLFRHLLDRIEKLEIKDLDYQ
jgi:hypothetical protein